MKTHKALLLALIMFMASFSAVHAYTTSDLQAQIQALLAQIQNLVQQLKVLQGQGGTTLLVASAIQPPNSLAPQGAANVPFTKFTLTAGSSDVTVTGIKVQQTGTAPDSVISNVSIMDDTMTSGPLLFGAPGFNDDHTMTLSGTLIIPAYTSRTFTVAGSMASNVGAASGQTLSLQIVGIGTAAPMTGALPITGATHTVNSTLVTGTLSVAKSNLPPVNTTVNSPNQVLGAFDTTVTNEPVVVHGMNFTLNATNSTGPQNVLLVDQTGRTVAGPVNAQITTRGDIFGPAIVSLYFSDTVTIPVGTTTYYLKGTLPVDYARQKLVITTIPASEWTGVSGSIYGYGIAPTPGAVTMDQVTVASAASITPSISITAPDKDIVQTGNGDQLAISWTSNLPSSAQVSIWLGTGDGSVKTDMSGITNGTVANSGSYVWTVNVINPGQYYIEVCYTDTTTHPYPYQYCSNPKPITIIATQNTVPSVSTFIVPMNATSSSLINVQYAATGSNLSNYNWRLIAVCPIGVNVYTNEGTYCSSDNTPMNQRASLGALSAGTQSLSLWVSNTNSISQQVNFRLSITQGSGSVESEVNYSANSVSVVPAVSVSTFPNNSDPLPGSGNCTGRTSFWWDLDNNGNQIMSGSLVNGDPRILCYNNPTDTSVPVHAYSPGTGYFYSPTSDWGGNAYKVSPCVQKGTHFVNKAGTAWQTTKDPTCPATTASASATSQFASVLSSLKSVLEGMQASF